MSSREVISSFDVRDCTHKEFLGSSIAPTIAKSASAINAAIERMQA